MLQRIKNRLEDQRGLTLIELLAVIVILGIVSAIAIPSILGIIDKSKKDATVAEAVQIINSAKLYVTTNPNATTITRSDLAQYLDNVKDPDFSITVNKVTTTTPATYNYVLIDHNAAPIVLNDATKTDVTEAQLRTYTNAD
jgi:type IV pilus assembly protein PilA